MSESKTAYSATGRRKTSVARVRIYDGEGKVTINNRDMQDYLPLLAMQSAVLQPFEVVDKTRQYDVKVNVRGGGYRGQADAIKLGVARALLKEDPERRKALKAEGLLRRDPRKKERKKAGKPGARKSHQFSKR